MEQHRRKFVKNHRHESNSPAKHNTLRSQLSKGMTQKLSQSANKNMRKGSVYTKGGKGGDDDGSHKYSDDEEPIEAALEKELKSKS